jgi:hypothetical protein
MLREVHGFYCFMINIRYKARSVSFKILQFIYLCVVYYTMLSAVQITDMWP